MAIRRLYIALPYLNTKLLANLSLDDKLRRMRAYICEAYEQLEETNTVGNEALLVFAAPEYFFQKSSTARFYSTAERDDFLSEMGGIAHACRNMLILPGTFCWRALKPFLQYEQMPKCKERDKRKAAVEKAIAANQIVYDGYNTAFIFYGKKAGRGRYYEYHKATDVVECLKNDKNTSYYVGAPPNQRVSDDLTAPREGGTNFGAFGLGKLDFGIEICGDSGRGILSQNVSIGRDSPYLFDVQILLSQGMDHQFATGALVRYPLHDGGLFIHCDGTEEFESGNGVFRMARGTGTHGTSAPLKVKVNSNAEAEEKKLQMRGLGYQAKIVKLDDEIWVYYYDNLGTLRSPTGSPGNVDRLKPLKCSTDEMKYWKADIQPANTDVLTFTA